jgi:hypothetical protein
MLIEPGEQELSAAIDAAFKSAGLVRSAGEYRHLAPPSISRERARDARIDTSGAVPMLRSVVIGLKRWDKR